MEVDEDDRVERSSAALADDQRPLFDRLHRLILAVYPDATVVLSYRIPTYRVCDRRLLRGLVEARLVHYGWQQGPTDAFTSRHPALKTSKGTLQLQPEDAAAIADDELSDLVRAALDACCEED